MQISQVSMGSDVSSKSKIRRRRTRRQTRVEVASGDFSERSIGLGIGLAQKPQGSENHTRNVCENEVEGDETLEDESLGTTMPEEVTLADIELMNRQKRSSRISELMTGEPQFV